YVMDQMATASATGLPPMRALFLEFPEEAPAWDASDQYMFGPDVLVAPVTAYGARERDVYLPVGASWLDAWTGKPVEKNGWVTAAAPLERIPVYLRQGGGWSDPGDAETGDSDDHEARGGRCTGTGNRRRRCGLSARRDRLAAAALCSQEAAARGLALPGPCDRVPALLVRS